jgi:hypothetical protein
VEQNRAGCVSEMQGMDSTRKTARLAGLLYLVSSLPAPFALMYVPGKLLVRGDAAATAERLRTSEGLLRAGIAAELVSSVIFIFLVLVLYRLFQPVAEGSALSMMVLILISMPISCVGVVLEIAAANFAGGGSLGFEKFLPAFGPGEREALAYLFYRLHGRAIMVAALFWGLWLFPFGVCVIRSGFIPRILGYLLMVAGCGYVAQSFAELSLPQYARAVGQVATITNFAELPIIFWLLIWGARAQGRRVGAA